MMSSTRRLVTLLAVLAAVLLAGGCEFTGVNSRSLPLTKGGGGDDLRVTVTMENAVNLVPNSEVKVSEVTVGSVRKIEFDHKTWTAKLTLGLEKGVRLPRNVRASIGQKSLLGAEYLSLEEPAEPSSTLLADGDVVGLDQTGRFPETEEVLSSLSLLLNGGGLGQVQTITRELNYALSGNETEVRSMIQGLDTFVGTLADQKKEIVAALDGLDNLAKGYAGDTQTIDRALRSVPAGVETLAAERAELTKTLAAVGKVGDITDQIVRDTREDLTANLDNLEQTVGGFADANDVLIDSLGSITWPFPVDAVLRGFAGDYINLFPTVDVSLGTIERDFLSGTPLDGIYSGLLEQIPGGSILGDSDLLTDPLNQSPGDGAGTSGPRCVLDVVPGLSSSCLGVGAKKPTGGSTKSTPKPSSSTPAPNLIDQLLGGMGGNS
ncbi:MAG: virulence factor Mce family protein [Aeromicrobium sp.]|nr:virulence factor Mce family protein [Aeromicrobium sp.]